MAKPFRKLEKDVLADPRRAARVDAYKRAIDAALRLAELRERRGLTQAELADALGVSQQRLSRVERQDDLFLSTLRSYVEMLGGELEIIAAFPEGNVRIDVPEPTPSA
jgi:DNA-binding XRE family transcriptional regulator